MTTALFIGRFQPMHNGHIYVIKEILKEHSKIIISIGSANKSHENLNPLTLEERKEMINIVMKKEHITNYEIIEDNDVNKHPLWMDNIKNNYQHFWFKY